MIPDIAFAGSPIDRADHIRADEARLGELNGPRAQLLLLDGLHPAIDDAGRLGWCEISAHDPADELVFLGMQDGTARFAAVPPPAAPQPAFADPRIRHAMARLAPTDLAIYGAARSLVDWHARHRFCARCGHGTILTKGGWQRNCTNPACRAEHFPRVDPVAIMLVEHADALLLGRQPRFPAGHYSALAGFIEPGETMEEAVRREVLEEASVRVANVRYVASQPWPFPSSLMLGCHALAEARDLTIDRAELEDARWFTRVEIEAAVAGSPEAPFHAPPAQTIAHVLLRWWLAR